MNKYQAQFDRCTGPAPKPLLKPKALTGIERQELEKLEEISTEYESTFWSMGRE